MGTNTVPQAIIGAAIEVHRRLGTGLLESACRKHFADKPRKPGFDVAREKPIPIIYADVHSACRFRANLVVNGSLVVELKVKSAIHPVDKAHTLSHLRPLKFRVGLLINFHEVKLVDGVNRIVDGHE